MMSGVGRGATLINYCGRGSWGVWNPLSSLLRGCFGLSMGYLVGTFAWGDLSARGGFGTPVDRTLRCWIAWKLQQQLNWAACSVGNGTAAAVYPRAVMFEGFSVAARVFYKEAS
ncbi:hypothetical protein TSMEX_004325 [Taenia solium]|eukprot:TsM_001020100 transcript=TsM_001020100 gene=TsM_001020100